MKGSTLVIMQIIEEPNCFFGGMAVPLWRSDSSRGSDPAD